MIDYGTYEIKKDLITGEYVLTEKLEGKKFYFDSREGLIRYIENDILTEKLEGKKFYFDSREG